MSLCALPVPRLPFGLADNSIAAGKGLETCRTFGLVQFNWYGFLAFIMVCIFAIAICLWLRLHEHVQWKNLQDKYSRHKRTPN